MKGSTPSMRAWWRLIAITALTIAVMTPARQASAQMDEAFLGPNWENAQKVARLMVEAAEKNDRTSAANFARELRDNLSYVEERIAKAGRNLHENDKAWQRIILEKGEKVLRSLQKASDNVKTLETEFRNVDKDYRSQLGRFKSDWNDFYRDFKQHWEEFRKHRVVLEETLKQFDNYECRRCR